MLSVCMITRNEAHCVADAIMSVKTIADELIVVDTGSTDSTVDIVRDLGATVIPFEWCDDFSQARNVSVKHASGDWILFLDADEVIAPIDTQKILACCASSTPVAGYMMIQRNYTNDHSRVRFVPCSGGYPEEQQASGFVPVERIGLFRNDPRIRFSGIIHETVAPSIYAINGVVGMTDIVVHHYGHLNSELRNSKTDYYLQLGLQQIKLTPDSAKPYYDVGLIYLNRGNFISAQDYLLKAFDIDAGYLDLALHLALLYFKWHKYDQALQYTGVAEQQGTQQQTVMLLKGILYDAIGQYDTARSLFKQGTKKFPGDRAFKESLAFLSLRLNDLSTAEQLLIEIFHDNPLYMPAFRGLVQVYYARGDYRQALSMIIARESAGYYEIETTIWKLLLYVRTGAIEKLPDGINLLIQKGYTGGELSFFQGIVAQEQGDIGTAVSLFSTALRSCPHLADEIKSRVASLSLRSKN